jgi:hypothetical protein
MTLATTVIPKSLQLSVHWLVPKPHYLISVPSIPEFDFTRVLGG